MTLTVVTGPQDECAGETHHVIRTGLNDSCEAGAGARKALTIYSGFETWYDSSAIVVMVGQAGRINNPKSFFHGDDGFNILCLERVEPIGSGESARRKYESWWGWV